MAASDISSSMCAAGFLVISFDLRGAGQSSGRAQQLASDKWESWNWSSSLSSRMSSLLKVRMTPSQASTMLISTLTTRHQRR